MQSLKKIISLILFSAILISTGLPAVAKDYSWDDISTKTGVYITSDGVSMPWRPVNGYVSEQNPPDFTWPYVNKATSYDFRICTRPYPNDGKVYGVDGLTVNYHNLNQTLETGKVYYWFVRYNKADGSSDWSEPRKFTIDPDAHIFTVESIDDIMKKVPSSHPRIFTTHDNSNNDYIYNLKDFRELKETTKNGEAVATYTITKAKRYVNNNAISDEPVDIEQEKADSVARGVVNQIVDCGFAALVMEDDDPEKQKVVDHCIRAMMKISDWNVQGLTSHKANDQVNREIMFRGCMAYDWVYDYMTDAERKKFTDMIKVRWDAMGDFADKITKNPMDSHGWTILGYQGIVSYALMNDVDWAEEKFREILPLYTAVLPPWSTQDGGGSQGTGYWKYGTNSNKEFIDVIQLAGLTKLYDKAWLKNEPEWILYTNTKGSWGSFGDDANTNLAESNSYIKQSMARHMFFNNSALAARICNDLGGMDKSYRYNYYTAPAENMEQDNILAYPRGHKMKDLHWAIMSSDLGDPDRVQFTFKSSPYGSYNHSHSDQNAFVIQAYGEKLAVRSGFYDHYGEDHHMAVTNASHSHNTITVDGGKGQAKDSFSAKGYIDQFATHLSFDSVTGRAGGAYIGDSANSFGGAFNGTLDKFDRSIIYVRPDVFVVVDDLKATEGKTSSFEWWLNSPNTTIETNDSEKSAHIENGRAHLMTRVLYPQNITLSEIYGGYINPADGKEYIPLKPHDEETRMSRMNFATDKVASTLMVTTMSVYEDGTEENKPTVYQNDEYMKLTFKDGTKVVINLGDENAFISVDGFNFMGRALTYNKNSVMLTDGYYLDEDYSILINAMNPVTVAMGLGEISIGSGTATSAEFMYPNKYVDIENLASFKDYQGRTVSKDIGLTVTDMKQFDTIQLDMEAGDYILLDDSYGIFTPNQLFSKEITLQKTSDGKAAVYWDEISPRKYDITIDGVTKTDVTSPYVFDMPQGKETVCITVREKVSDIMGPVSPYSYLSNYDDELRDTVQFSKSGTKVQALSRLVPDGNTNLFVASYENDGSLKEMVEANVVYGDYTSATVSLPLDGTVRAFLVADNLKPLTSDANYGSDSTDLAGIWIDGEALSDFDSIKDSYAVEFTGGNTYFPYVSAKAEDSTAEVDVEYNFTDLSAKIIVTAPSGTQREVTIDFTHKMQNIHFVKGATEEANFRADSDGGVKANGEAPMRSRSTVGKLSYIISGKTTTTNSYVYTDMRGNAGEGTTGSKTLSDRTPNKNNHHELESCNKYLEGFDYFALPLAFYNKVADASDITFTFELDSPAEVAIVTVDDMPSLTKSQGFTRSSAEGIKYRYMGFKAGPEDIYYNSLIGCPVTLTEGSYLDDYAYFDIVRNVLPLESYDNLAEYEANAPGPEQFETDDTIGYSSKSYSYMYTRDFDAGVVTIDFSDMSHSGDRAVIVVKPITPKPFEYKLK